MGARGRGRKGRKGRRDREGRRERKGIPARLGRKVHKENLDQTHRVLLHNVESVLEKLKDLANVKEHVHHVAGGLH